MCPFTFEGKECLTSLNTGINTEIYKMGQFLME